LAVILVSAVAGQGGNTQICMTRNQVIHGAAMLYAADHNDRLVPIMSGAWENSCARTTYLAQLLLPYHNDWVNYRCPADRNVEGALSQDVCLGGVTRVVNRQQQFATWSMLAHRGYNYMFLAPITDRTISYPINQSQIADPSSTIMFMDSIWDRNAFGEPTGGGCWGVDPPCIRDAQGNLIPPFPPGFTTYYHFGGWNLHPQSGGQYGYNWPWHNRTFVGVMADGTARTFTVENLTNGCNVQSGFAGRVTNMKAYLWDIYE
ncbi:MAG: hypothetical protein M3R13_09315, partial [Armatimonadota bacterium]|nr:hypothetical protein [Armatimonadota bacterium]